MSVLVAYDGSDPARTAFHHAIEHHPNEEIRLLRVVEAADSSTGAALNLAQGLFEDRETSATADIEELVEQLDADVRTAVVTGDPAGKIVDYANEHEVDLIVVGNHGRTGATRVLLGSVAEAVSRRAAVPVTIVR